MNIFSFMEFLDAIFKCPHEGKRSLLSPQHITNVSLSGFPHSFPNYLALILSTLGECLLSSAPSFYLKTSCSFSFSYFPHAMKHVTLMPLNTALACLLVCIYVLKNV